MGLLSGNAVDAAASLRAKAAGSRLAANFSKRQPVEARLMPEGGKNCQVLSFRQTFKGSRGRASTAAAPSTAKSA